MFELSDNIIQKIRDLYIESLSVYCNCPKPNNYIANYIKKRINVNITSEVIYCIIHNMSEIPKCPICGKDCKFRGFGYGFLETCSRKHKIGHTKGKTYLEIYGTSTPKCGFKRGDLNVAKKEDIRQKISKGIKLSYDRNNGELRKRRSLRQLSSNRGMASFKGKTISDSHGNLYRSKLEAQFSDILIENNIPFKYEVPIKLLNGHFKWVDFVIDDRIFVEITGYAYDKWQKDFNKKIKKLNETLDNNENIIYILTYEDKIDILKCCLLEDTSKLKNSYNELISHNGNIIYKKSRFNDKMIDHINNIKYKNLYNQNIFFNNINDSQNIIKDIKFIQTIIKGKEYLKYENS